ncbi:MAG: DUF6443 domain-containing protein [Bacteroidota bacterium]
MQKYSCIIALLFLSVITFAQPINNLIGDVQMKPPGIASLSRYEDIPVSFFTGTPNISLPIYEVVEGTISLPLRLSYHSSGVKVAETSSWIGLGWDLSNGGGGFVSRTTQGIPDDRSGGYYSTGAPLDPCDPNVMPPDRQQVLEQAKNGMIDSEPDIYQFQFGGKYSGKFFFGPNKVPVLVPNQDIKIEPIEGNVGVQGFGTNAIRGWKFTTPDGTQYYFGGFDDLTTPIADLVVDKMTVNGITEISTWYLIEIASYDNEYKISLSYIDEAYSYRSPASCQQVIAQCQNQNGQAGGSEFQCLGFNGSSDFHINRVDGQRLSQISCSTCIIDFIAETDRLDLDPFQDGQTALPNQLDSIKITTGNYCKAFAMTHSYFETTNSPLESEDRRLRLDALQEVACDGSVSVAPYSFDYNTTRLPNRLSRAIDHWGYYNGANFNPQLNIPPTEVTLPGGDIINAGSANREPNASFSDAAILEQINYPEGGYTRFDYEQHEYYSNATTETINKIFIANLSNCTVPDANCCSSQDAMVVDSFSQLEITEGRFSLAITDVSASGAMSCNLMADSEIILEIFDNVEDTIAGSVGYNVPGGENGYQEYDWNDFSLTAGVFYRLELSVQGAKGEFSLWRNETITSVAGNLPVGGLRIQQTTVHDGIDHARDIIKSYEYTDAANPTRSSGILYQDPEYGYSLGVIGGDAIIVALFTSTSITPLANFDGYHIGYERVIERHDNNENGTSIYNYIVEQAPQNGTFPYPIAPPLATVKNTQLESVGHFRKDNTAVAQTNQSQDTGSDDYTSYDGVMFKIQDIPIPAPPQGGIGCAPISAYQCYSMRTGQYLIGTVEETIDGVTTITTYDYADNLAHLAPTIERMTNSDGKVYETENKYVFNRGPFQAYTEMIDRNIIATPYETTMSVIDNGTPILLSGTRTNHDFFDANGEPQGNANSAGADPYAHELFSFKRTFDENGNPTVGFWELEATVEKRFADGIQGKSGYPEIAQTADWSLKDSLDYENGVLVSYTYGNHKRTQTLHPGTRMMAKRTDIDGQPVFFNYDQLMRVDTILARPKTSISNPSPQQTDDFNVVTTFGYFYPPNANNNRAYTKTRIDYAPEPTGNSNFEWRESYNYTDGSGRLIQTVERQHTQDSLDVVIAREYDNQGRIIKVFEPFASSANTGEFVPKASLPDKIYKLLLINQPTFSNKVK